MTKFGAGAGAVEDLQNPCFPAAAFPHFSPVEEVKTHLRRLCLPQDTGLYKPDVPVFTFKSIDEGF